MVWEQMKPGDDWDMLIEQMWEYQWTQEIVPLTDELRTAIYEESQGIVDIAVKLYTLAQSRAIGENETIGPALVRKVAREDLRLVQPMLNALRSGLISEIEKYEDIMPMNLSSVIQMRQSQIDIRATIQKKKEQQEEARQKYESSITEKAIHALISLDVDAKTAEKIVLKIIKEGSDMQPAQVVKQALAKLETEKQQLKQTKIKGPQLNKLAEIIEQGKHRKLSAYESMKEAGIIKDPCWSLLSRRDSMLGFFPRLYPEELLYSWLARYHLH